MLTIILSDTKNKVAVVDDYTVEFSGHYYEITGPSDPIYTDHDYISFNGGIWVKTGRSKQINWLGKGHPSNCICPDCLDIEEK